MLAPLEREKGMIRMIMLLKDVLQSVCIKDSKYIILHVCEHIPHMHNNLHKMNTAMCPVTPQKCVVCIRSILLALRTQKCM